MRTHPTLWLLWVPYFLGVWTIVGMATLYIRWDIQQIGIGSRRTQLPLSLKLKASAPFFLAIALFTLEHLIWTMALPWFGTILIKVPYDNQIGRVLARCLLHLFAAFSTYLVSDSVCRRLLKSPFERFGKRTGGTGAELNEYVSLSQALPANEQPGAGQ
jgi:hypothetical protein